MYTGAVTLKIKTTFTFNPADFCQVWHTEIRFCRVYILLLNLILDPFKRNRVCLNCLSQFAWEVSSDWAMLNLLCPHTKHILPFYWWGCRVWNHQKEPSGVRLACWCTLWAPLQNCDWICSHFYWHFNSASCVSSRNRSQEQHDMEENICIRFPVSQPSILSSRAQHHLYRGIILFMYLVNISSALFPFQIQNLLHHQILLLGEQIKLAFWEHVQNMRVISTFHCYAGLAAGYCLMQSCMHTCSILIRYFNPSLVKLLNKRYIVEMHKSHDLPLYWS